MLKFGFELEAFTLDLVTGDPVLVPSGLPKDECGWLTEIRSEPHSGVAEAIALLRVEQLKTEMVAAKEGVTLSYQPLLEIPRELKVQAAREHGKGLIRYRNLYGHETHRCPTKLQTASLHVSVTNQTVSHYVTAKNFVDERVERGFIDFAQLVVRLDKAFKDEIRKAKRNPGFYEVKHDARIEYRSLPNDIDLAKLESELELLRKYLL